LAPTCLAARPGQAEHRQCRPYKIGEQCWLGPDANEHAKPHHDGKQHPCDIARSTIGRNLPHALPGNNASPEKSFDHLRMIRDELLKVTII
jgi:hypothetical protein